MAIIRGFIVKGKVLMSLFALPFFGVGVWMLWSVSSTLVDARQMQGWESTEARLITAGYETHSGDDSDTYEAYARYRYSYGGAIYQGDRVSISGSADNIGDYQQNLGRQLSGALARGDSIDVFVDPASPSHSVVDRSVRWGLLGFKSIFLFVFGGVGLFLLIAAWRAPKEKDATLPEYQKSPWLLNDKWQTSTIRSGSKNAMRGAWAFAAIWSLISAPLPFVIYTEVIEKDNTIALVGLMFPLVGIGLLVWAIRRTLEWRRFGAAPVTLDPFPGSIGGHLGGTIDLGLPFDAASHFQLTLTNIHSYVSGSGKNRSQKEKALWQDALIAHAEHGGKGTRLTFRFDIPEGFNESDTKKDDSYYLWRLNLKAELPGTDLDRDYELPVYATATESRYLSNQAVQNARAKQNAFDEQSVRDVVNLRYDAQGKKMHFPMGRHFASSIGGFIVGAIFASVGWYLIFEVDRQIFGSVFGGVGGLIAIFCLYMMLNSLEISQDSNGIKSVRRLLGIPVSRKRMHRNSFKRFEKDSSFQSQSGGKHVIYYSIHAVDNSGNKVVVGEGFKGESEANAAIRLIASEFGLTEPAVRGSLTGDDGYLGADVLAADR